MVLSDWIKKRYKPSSTLTWNKDVNLPIKSYLLLLIVRSTDPFMCSCGFVPFLLGNNNFLFIVESQLLFTFTIHLIFWISDGSTTAPSPTQYQEKECQSVQLDAAPSFHAYLLKNGTAAEPFARMFLRGYFFFICSSH